MKGKKRDIILCGVMGTGNRDLRKVLLLTAGYDSGLTPSLTTAASRSADTLTNR